MDSPARSSGTPEPEGVSSAYPRIYFNIGVFDIVKANHVHISHKVFVTHGGLGSLVEAIYHKAVIVGVPLRCNQNEIIFSIVIIFFTVTIKNLTYFEL